MQKPEKRCDRGQLEELFIIHVIRSVFPSEARFSVRPASVLAAILNGDKSRGSVFSFPLKLPGLDQAPLGRGEIGTPLQNCRELRDRLINPFLSQISPAQIIAGFEVVRLETQRFAKTGDRVGEFSL